VGKNVRRSITAALLHGTEHCDYPIKRLGDCPFRSKPRGRCCVHERVCGSSFGCNWTRRNLVTQRVQELCLRYPTPVDPVCASRHRWRDADMGYHRAELELHYDDHSHWPLNWSGSCARRLGFSKPAERRGPETREPRFLIPLRLSKRKSIERLVT